MFKRRSNRRRATLADCTACGSDFVHPVEWSPLDSENWWMLLRCANAGLGAEEKVPDSEAELYDRALGRAERGIRTTADRLSREALEAELDVFSTALELDLIGAEDFAR